MNKQEIVNTVYKHLKAQGKQALDSDWNCAYRTASGLKCAIGCLIPDALYTNLIETKLVSSLFKIGFLQKVFPDITEEDVLFLSQLQRIHDYDFNSLDFEFQKLCVRYKLEFPDINNLESLS